MMDRPSSLSNADTTEAIESSHHISSTDCYALDAQRESMSPEQFTATYNQARDFIREAGQCLSMRPLRAVDKLTSIKVSLSKISQN